MDIHVQYLYGLDIYANIKLLQFLIAFIYGNIIYILHGMLTWTYTLADLKFKKGQILQYGIIVSFRVIILIVNMCSWENTIQPWYYVITNVLLSSEFLLFGLGLCRRAGLRSRGSRGSLPPAGAELPWSHTPHLCSLALENQIPFVSTLSLTLYTMYKPFR